MDIDWKLKLFTIFKVVIYLGVLHVNYMYINHLSDNYKKFCIILFNFILFIQLIFLNNKYFFRLKKAQCYFSPNGKHGWNHCRKNCIILNKSTDYLDV